MKNVSQKRLYFLLVQQLFHKLLFNNLNCYLYSLLSLIILGVAKNSLGGTKNFSMQEKPWKDMLCPLTSLVWVQNRAIQLSLCWVKHDLETSLFDCWLSTKTPSWLFFLFCCGLISWKQRVVYCPDCLPFKCPVLCSMIALVCIDVIA